MFGNKVGSGRKTVIPQEKTIPRSAPHDPIFPDPDNYVAPTPPTNKFAIKKTNAEFASRPEPEIMEARPTASPERQRKAQNIAIPEVQRMIPNRPTEDPYVKIAALEDERDLLLDEINKIRLVKIALENELEKQKGLVKERDELLRIVDMLNRRIAELEAKAMNNGGYDLSRVLFMIEIERLHSLLSEKLLEIELLQKNLTEAQNVARSLDFELQQWKYRYAELERNSAFDKGSIEEELRRRLEIEIQHVRTNDQLRWDAALQKLAIEKQESQNKIILMSTEFERMHGLNWQLKEESDRLKMRVRELEIELERAKQNTEYQSKLALLASENERLNLLLVDKNKEVELLRQKLAELGTNDLRLKELESKIILLAMEDERLRNAYQAKAREVEVWREKYTKLESIRVEEVQSIISKNAELSKRVALSFEESERIMKLFKELESEHTLLRNKYQSISRELEDMYHAKNDIGPIEETPKKAALKHDIITKITSIGVENLQYEQTQYEKVLDTRESYPQTYSHSYVQDYLQGYPQVYSEENPQILRASAVGKREVYQ